MAKMSRLQTKIVFELVALLSEIVDGSCSDEVLVQQVTIYNAVVRASKLLLREGIHLPDETVRLLSRFYRLGTAQPENEGPDE